MRNDTRIACLVPTGFCYGRDLVYGINRYASQHNSWMFDRALSTMTSYQIRPHDIQIDGYIVHVTTREMEERIRLTGKPAVNTSTLLSETVIPTVAMNNREIGKMAAEYFLERGMKHCAFFGGGGHYAVVREAGFVARLAKAGVSCSSYVDDIELQQVQESGVPTGHPILRWLKSLPRPLGMLASNDSNGLCMTDLCLLEEIMVPEEIAILGVDNDTLRCFYGNPPLSSIDVAGERIGYLAAELLDQMLKGKPAPTEPILVPPKEVVTRRSTDTYAISDSEVAKVMNFIKTHLDENICVSDILTQTNLSRRRMEQRFQEAVGCSPMAELHRLRVNQAKELLENSEMSMAEIADTCGMCSQQYFSKAFHQDTGYTPMAYRRAFKKG